MAEQLASFAARLAGACRAAGLPVGPDRAARFAAAVAAVEPSTAERLRHCATATLASAPEHVAAVQRALEEVLAGVPEVPADPADGRRSPARAVDGPAGAPAPPAGPPAGGGAGPEQEHGLVASAREQLGGRDFAELTPGELAALESAMRALRLATPLRRTRRTRPAARGRVDVRASLRAARSTGGDALRLVRREPRREPRRLVVLCDISGSMSPYARAMVQLLYCAAGGIDAEVFTFATRLTRITPALARTSPAEALARAGEAAPDWSGGTRIGESLRAFNDTVGVRGLARGAVVLIVSDGWDTGDPAVLGAQLARLRRVAHRIVWANPRAHRPGFAPRTGGMAAARPHCDAVVGVKDLDSLPELLAALTGTASRTSSW
ncbi:vWA domain-containing protein [Pseudonocardia thermophila]|uniref:vWA domain-containing protein n=1 Tax=Pseudonocardia thermophila TaxID=1848 RepID=UPI00248DC013|nr:VWA domain-containing protein [Pseudonocardia thermophila]